MSAESPITAQWPDPQLQDYSSKSYALSGRIMLASIVILFVVVFFLVLLHLYARWYLLRLRRRQHSHRRTRRRTRIVFYVDSNRVPPSPTGGLDSSVLKSLPLFVYSAETGVFSDGNTPECAVCLSEFEEGETGRVLPKCKHSFHTQCIDMWFCSNSTCPLCRSPVEPPPVEPEMKIFVNQHEPGSAVPPIPPAVETGTASFADTRKRVDVRIEVPTRPTRNELVTSGEFDATSPSQGFRSPGARLLALKRIMNWRSPAPSPTAAAAAAGVGPSFVIPVAGELDGESGGQESNR